jgi:hypothetical protein
VDPHRFGGSSAELQLAWCSSNSLVCRSLWGNLRASADNLFVAAI